MKGTNEKPAVVRVQTEERAQEIFALCEQNGWKVLIGIEPDKAEDITDVTKLLNPRGKTYAFKAPVSKNSPCPCGSGKQYKRCCMK